MPLSSTFMLTLVGLPDFGIDQHHIRDVNGCLELNPTTLWVLLALPQVLVDHVDALNDDPSSTSIYSQHLAALAFVCTADDLYQVIAFQPGHRTRLSHASNHFGCEADDLHVVLLTELPCHSTEDPRTLGVPAFIDHDHGISVKSHIGAIFRRILFLVRTMTLRITAPGLISLVEEPSSPNR